jgi:hypothetical protein
MRGGFANKGSKRAAATPGQQVRWIPRIRLIRAIAGLGRLGWQLENFRGWNFVWLRKISG